MLLFLVMVAFELLIVPAIIVGAGIFFLRSLDHKIMDANERMADESLYESLGRTHEKDQATND